ncbi:MAG: hypothetical protein U9O98_11410 [Asgard group archaeon]|nr:hypothetical protein [Asgard group archaeon]
MSQENKLFHICHLLFSYGITKPEKAKTFEELQSILKLDENYKLKEIMEQLVEEGYVGNINNQYFLLGKGIVAVAAIFT